LYHKDNICVKLEIGLSGTSHWSILSQGVALEVGLSHCSILHELFDIQISLSILTFTIDVLVFNISSVLTDDEKSKK